MIGQALGRYRIIEELGAGGMGEIYRARDEHLNRDVAIKVLPTGTLADEHARKRFRKEAQTLSKLNHPHIATVYDFDTENGVDFLVMEYIPGVTLSQKLVGGPLQEKEISQLGSQMAEGLAAAHKQDIVHRDIKPGNLRVTPEGRLEILDFGIAKLLRPVTGTATTESFTETQTMAGTLPYMPPEQLRGEPVDTRSDIYSSGVVLYEMATGQRPFQEKLPTALSDAILHQAPVTPRAVNARVSPELECIILKCLEKEPENRYQSAKELLVDLRRLGASATTRVAVQRRKRLRPTVALGVVLIVVVLSVASYFARQRFWPQATLPAGKVMLAVLPFDNLSNNPEQEYFSDGMTEEMIAQLGPLEPGRLGVIARTSVMLYKDSDKSIDRIGRELDVDYILEGSVRREEDRVRITAQLIQVSDQTHLWAEIYERDLADVFRIQSDVARRIARSLEVELLPAQQVRLAGPSSVGPVAHEAYLRGRYHWNKRTPEGVRRGLEYFQQAVEADPHYALAYTGIADSYTVGSGSYLGLQAKEAYSKARVAAERALLLDDTLAEAHASISAVRFEYDWDWAAAEEHGKQAIELNPNYATAHQWRGEVLMDMGRHQESIAEIKLARELDPFSLIINVVLGWSYIHARQFDNAIEQLRKTLELDPDFRNTHHALAWAYQLAGRPQEAMGEWRELAVLDGVTAAELAKIEEAYKTQGLLGFWRWRKDWLERAYSRGERIRHELVRAYMQTGEIEKAIDLLEKAYQERDSVVVYIKTRPWFDPLRSDPRFQSLLRRMNFPE